MNNKNQALRELCRIANSVETRQDVMDLFFTFENLFWDEYNVDEAREPIPPIHKWSQASLQSTCMLIDAEVELMRALFSNPMFPFIYMNEPDPCYLLLHMDKRRDFVFMNFGQRSSILFGALVSNSMHANIRHMTTTGLKYRLKHELEITQIIAFLEVSNAPPYVLDVVYENAAFMKSLYDLQEAQISWCE